MARAFVGWDGREGGAAAPPRARGSGSGLDLRHALGQQPKRLVHLHIGINTLDFARRGAAALAVGVAAPCGQPTTDDVLLNDVGGAPKVAALVVVA